MARLAGVSGRIFGSFRHDEVLERNLSEWNHANLRVVQVGDGGSEATAPVSPAAPPSSSSLSSLHSSVASPYLSDLPVGIDPNDITRFTPSFSRDNTRLQFMRIANQGLKM
jgi:hypothetical protein